MTGELRRIVYISGTRADFGLMALSLKALEADPKLQIEVLATGQHLDPAYGDTLADIRASGLDVTPLDPISLAGESGAEMADALSAQMRQLTAMLQERRPDLVLLLGDRGEMVAAGLAAVFLGLPVAHFHGGERSGTVDDQLRQAITALAHFHFPPTPGARDRLLRMGERPERISLMGAPGIDEIRGFSADPTLRARMGIATDEPLTTVLFHPVVQDATQAGDQAGLLIETLLRVRAGRLVVLAPNSDAGSAGIGQSYRAVRDRLAGSAEADRFIWLTHLPRADYLSLVATSDLLIGNSSSGVIEAASLQTPAVNLGDRQTARERNDSTFDCTITAEGITAAIASAEAYRGGFENVYDQGGCANRIAATIRALPLSPDILKKSFAY